MNKDLDYLIDKQEEIIKFLKEIRDSNVTTDSELHKFEAFW